MASVNFVTALAPEAAPLIERWELELVSRVGPFPVYARGDFRLVISGLGAFAAASAVGCLGSLADRDGDRQLAWINVGLAGHRDLELGVLRRAHKIIDDSTGHSWFPPLVFDSSCPTATVRTVASPEREFPEPDLYEMEAAGFFAAAARFSSAELVQCLKVVSDNQQDPARRPSRGEARERIAQQVDGIASVAEAVLSLVREVEDLERDPEELLVFLQRWRFSVTQQTQLRELLRRRALLVEGSALMRVEHLDHPRRVLQELADELDGVGLR